MKKIFVSLMAMMFLVVSVAFGISIDDFDYTVGSGEYLGTFEGNDSNATDLQNALATIDSLDTLYFFDKVNLPGTIDDTTYSNTYLTVSSNDGWLSGTWSTLPTFIDYYSVKAGNYFSLYRLVPALAEGVWTTYNISMFIGGDSLATRELSHFSSWNPSTPVPEPATLVLFGAGIAGLALYRRKRN